MSDIWHYLSNPWVYRIFWLVYVVTIGSCIAVLLSEKRNPIKSLAWIVALVFLPVFGLVFYLFFGRSMKNKRMISRHNKRKLLSAQHRASQTFPSHRLSPECQQLSRLASSLGATPLSYATDIRIFTTGREKFEALKRDLKGACKSINLQYYIFSSDRLGREIAAILMDKARSGVKVRVIYDHVGSFSAPNRFFTKMRRAGVEAHPFFRVTFPQLANRINWRNHRKVVIIDDKIGYTGGMNIARRYVEGLDKSHTWRDLHMRLEGPVVAGLQYAFAVDWNFMNKHTEIAPLAIRENSAPDEAKIPGQFLTSGPTDQFPSIAHLYEKAILAARKCIYIQTPYFLPTDSLLKALQTAALSGVDVRIMLPVHSDSKMLNYASYSYVTECLQAGIKVYMYEAGMLHSKVLIADDEFVSAGSTNFDFRSFEHNFEGNLLLYDRDVCRQFKDQFFADASRSYKLTYATWSTRPRALRLRESLIRLLSPIL